jgi:hypothetical protein
MWLRGYIPAAFRLDTVATGDNPSFWRDNARKGNRSGKQ